MAAIEKAHAAAPRAPMPPPKMKKGRHPVLDDGLRTQPCVRRVTRQQASRWR
jgi:hypothetical protein